MATRKDEIKARLLATFQAEAYEHLQAITAHLATLDGSLPSSETRPVIEALFREVHTLKGAARSVSLTEVEALCQTLESTLSRITRGNLALSRPVLDALHEGVDGVSRLLTSDGAAAATDDASGRRAETSATAATPGLPPMDTIRLSTAALDALFTQAEDLLIPKLVSGERVGDVRALSDALAECRTALDRIRAGRRLAPANAGEADVLAELDAALQVVETRTQKLLGQVVRDQRTIAGSVDGVLDEMRRLRMTPASAVLDLFPRMVRDLAREQGKEVEWTTRGADLEVDRKVLEAMKEPLIHLVRNAVDHGIEPAETRVGDGKPRQGRVTVALALLEGNRIEIRVEDDGRGIDLAQVRAAATRARVVSGEQAQILTDEEALRLVFRSGLSTSPIITKLSGHGLGLAIVEEQVERLGGEIRMASEAGSGTTVRMVLPATIATFRGLLVHAGEQPFLLPSEAVEAAIRVSPSEIERLEGQEAIRFKGGALPISELALVLRLPAQQNGRDAGSKRPCLVISAGEERAGLLVDEVVGAREVLVKELKPPLIRVRNVAGAGLLGTGQMVLILRPADLLRSVGRAARPPAAAAEATPSRRAPVILVVDDSITTRTMERNLLEAAGYQVKVAVDGVDAWTLLKSETFDLVVSDVDMPRMDGFELTSRIRADRELADLPVVLVTALEARDDKERGIDVGANAYIVKSSFDESNLLEIIRRLA